MGAIPGKKLSMRGGPRASRTTTVKDYKRSSIIVFTMRMTGSGAMVSERVAQELECLGVCAACQMKGKIMELMMEGSEHGGAVVERIPHETHI
jgi:hypothetical protein